MQELIEKLQNNHGLSTEQSHGVLNTIKDFIKEKFPMIGSAVDNLFHPSTTGTDTGTETDIAQAVSGTPVKNPEGDFMDRVSDLISGKPEKK